MALNQLLKIKLKLSCLVDMPQYLAGVELIYEQKRKYV